MNAKVESNERDESFAHLGQRTVLRKTEVIHGDIATRKDDGHKRGVFAECPFLLGNIDKLIRNALDGEFGIQHLFAVDAHRGVDLKLSSRELPHPVDERLCGKVFNLGWCERKRTLADGLSRSHLLADHYIVGLQESVFRGEQGYYIAIELVSQQHDGHSDEIGEYEPHKLRNADMFL